MARAKQPSGTGSHLILAGVILYLVAWFIPAFQGQGLLGPAEGWVRALSQSPSASTSVLDGPDWLPGWQACRFAWNLLLDDRGTDPDAWRAKVVGSTCLTNIVMLAAILMLLARRRDRAMGAFLIACAVLNASWIYLAKEGPFGTYRPGYYLWTLSFAVLGIGMTAAADGKATA